MSNETLHTILTGLLTLGCAPLIKWIVDRIKEEFTPSPKTTRRVAYLVSVAAPSVVYGLLALSQGLYEWPAHLLAVVGAFTASQVLHGETALPTGQQERLQEHMDGPKG